MVQLKPSQTRNFGTQAQKTIRKRKRFVCVFSHLRENGSYKVKNKRCKTTLWQHFITQRIVDKWNSLPTEVTEAPNLISVKNRVDLLMRDHMYSLEEPPTNIRSGN